MAIDSRKSSMWLLGIALLSSTARPVAGQLPGSRSASPPNKSAAQANQPPTAKVIRRTLEDLVPAGGKPGNIWQAPPPPQLDDAAVLALGIRKISGRHVDVYTDLPMSPDVDDLPAVFDAAVPQWCAYFDIPAAQVAGWKTVGYLIQDKERFQRAGLLPENLPPFLNGYQRGAEMWLYEQTSAYYRRHLLLHEGTHGFMRAGLGGCGPPWYMEGMAELLATHRWQDRQLTVNYSPRRKTEVEGWGRIKIVRDGYRQAAAKSLYEILHFDNQAHLRVEPYGWSWAVAAFFDGHPVYQHRFRELRKFARDGEATFSERFIGLLQDDWFHANREWQLFVSRLDYGYDVAREAIVRREAGVLSNEGATVTVSADHGWQSSGLRLEAGKRYQITASGRYQVGNQPKAWWCEPNGVTIRYCGGRPLGMVLGAIVEESVADDTSNGFLTPAPIGTGLETTLRRSGTLYVRINDYPTELADNQGQVAIQIKLVP